MHLEGDKVFTGGDSSIAYLWDISELHDEGLEEPKFRFHGHLSSVTGLCYSPALNVLATGSVDRLVLCMCLSFSLLVSSHIAFPQCGMWKLEKKQ